MDRDRARIPPWDRFNEYRRVGQRADAKLYWWLEREPIPRNWDQILAERYDITTPVMVTRNGVGYRQKQGSVLRYLDYELAQAGDTIYAPDSLWLSELWAALLVQAAMRGVDVHAIAPSKDHAPSKGKLQLALTYDIFAGLAIAKEALGLETLHPALYSYPGNTGDLRARAREILDAGGGDRSTSR